MTQVACIGASFPAVLVCGSQQRSEAEKALSPPQMSPQRTHVHTSVRVQVKRGGGGHQGESLPVHELARV